ncbi:cytochrome P450 [Tanacetum coccineum]|uniref:Cytochrome P450 n=1 Tax=Tanacetum coccineum TaxID=301880 RepID=A0ABQ4WBZ0_9ASTR
MCEVRHCFLVNLNGRVVPIKMFEESFNASSLLSPLTISDGDFILRMILLVPLWLWLRTAMRFFPMLLSALLSLINWAMPYAMLITSPKDGIPDLNDPIDQVLEKNKHEIDIDVLLFSKVGSQLDKSGTIDKDDAVHIIGEQLGYSFNQVNRVVVDHVDPMVGASRGILTMWDSRTFSVDQTFTNRYFVGVVGYWIGTSNPIGLLDVYAPQSSPLKEALWSAIESLINTVNASWVVFGYFNVVRSQDERSGCYFDSGYARVFNDFISRTGLFDLPLGGRRFTRFDKDGRKASKLDRFLISSGFFDVWNDVNVSVLCRSYSDHCPLLIKVGALNASPKPYKVFDKWISNAEYRELVSSYWADSSITFPLDFGLKVKLKELRMSIKSWCSNHLAIQNNDKDSLSNNLIE